MPQLFNINSDVNDNLTFLFMDVNQYSFIKKFLYKANSLHM